MFSKIGADPYQFTETVVKQVDSDLQMDNLLKDSSGTGRLLLQFGLRSFWAMFSFITFFKLPVGVNHLTLNSRDSFHGSNSLSLVLKEE